MKMGHFYLNQFEFVSEDLGVRNRDFRTCFELQSWTDWKISFDFFLKLIGEND